MKKRELDVNIKNKDSSLEMGELDKIAGGLSYITPAVLDYIKSNPGIDVHRERKQNLEKLIGSQFNEINLK